MPSHEKDFLTPKQLAHRWQVSVEYLYRAVLGLPGGIPAMKLGNGSRARWRIALGVIEDWERKHSPPHYE
ncbi:helix-turn-helix domain-containing protein [Nitrospira defluvii]|uniref:Helix-turn-helix domain-containing protein n=1 Tax=Nitrospira defluvii TaxID=330214 RepID=A0ABM8R9L9_9BACT|nr:helix-turn-helix domain-containing protein [Nitrospira defluvii]CAE6740775.1 hypothetical protein NSPZN2_130080 [Nitrospira defluvii]